MRSIDEEVSIPVGTGRIWNLPALDNVELLRANSITCSYPRHMHDAYSIGVIEAGVGGTFYKGGTHFSPPGSLILMNPGDVHTGFSVGNAPLSYRMIYVSHDQMHRLIREVPRPAVLHFTEPVIHNSPLASQILHFHSITESAESNLKLEELFAEAISEIISSYGNVFIPEIKSQQKHRAVKQIKSYLRENYSQNITLEELATLTSLNRCYLVRVFRDEVGLPPYAYLTQVRIEQAKRLLASGQPSTEVALAVGFADQSHLTRFFKRIVGVTPARFAESQYRSRYSKSISFRAPAWQASEEH